eukprot:TRINITY_DN96238_c0_g1_i1.p1 TRINITY_DN96238_c0_g1~~TRINITY_DN96238_c0_g1_i1.p1  ORF type:complete len:283 (-),score=85.85 TRINITY_DN96238_c0_g1_i1:162-1010(-)
MAAMLGISCCAPCNTVHETVDLPMIQQAAAESEGMKSMKEESAEEQAKARLDTMLAERTAQDDLKNKDAQDALTDARLALLEQRLAEAATKEEEREQEKFSALEQRLAGLAAKDAASLPERLRAEKEKVKESKAPGKDKTDPKASLLDIAAVRPEDSSKKAFEFEVKIEGARGLKAKTGPFVIAECTGKMKSRFRTKASTDKEKPAWNQKTSMTLFSGDKVKITVNEESKDKKSDLLGSAELRFSEISEGFDSELKITSASAKPADMYLKIRIRLLRSYIPE